MFENLRQVIIPGLMKLCLKLRFWELVLRSNGANVRSVTFLALRVLKHIAA